MGEGALHIEIGLDPSNYARMTAGAFRGIDPVGAFASLARLESPALARLTGIVESIRVIGDFFRMKLSLTPMGRSEVIMKIIKQILVVSLLGLFLAGCGDSGETGPFGNTPGPKKPQQM